LLLDENESLSELSGEGALGGSIGSVPAPSQEMNEAVVAMPNVAAIVFFCDGRKFCAVGDNFLFDIQKSTPFTHPLHMKYNDFGKLAKFT